MVPAEVLTWVRDVFGSCNRAVTAQLSNNPNAAEESFDHAWIAHLNSYATPQRLGNGWTVKIETHFLGGMRHFRRWEIADIGILLFIRDPLRVATRKVALLQSKRLYPTTMTVREETTVDYEIGFARLADPSDRVPVGAEHVVVDVLADSQDAAPAQLHELLANPAKAEEGKSAEIFESAYREIVTLPSARAGYRLLFTQLTEDEHRPGLIHCTTGKDRTGWAAAALLSLVGVDRKLVTKEYLLTNDELLPALQPLFDHFEQAGGRPEVLRPILGVEQSYLEAAFDEMTTTFGTIESYFAEGLDIDADGQRRLVDVFVEPSNG